MDGKRRNFLGYMAVLGLAGVATIPVYEKIPRLAINYQSHSEDGHACRECANFQADSVTCNLIEGVVRPEGCCRLFESPSAYETAAS
jgi:hypothetical protein